MNRQAILHMPDSKFCYATGDKTVEILLRVDKNDKFDEVNIVYGNKYDYYLQQIKTAMELRFTDNCYGYYFVRLELSDVRLVYIFELKENGKTFYFCEDGVTDKYDFSLAYFNSFQFPYINRADVMPAVGWLSNAVFYQIFVDRFYCGDKNKDRSYVNLKWGDLPNPKSFAGGDLQGIIDKLDYIQSLGVTALYLTPIFTAKSNHKYDISDYYNVDKQFGANVDFKRLVEQAHARGIRVVLDAVFNHCSEDFAQFQDVVKHGKKSKYYNWFIVNGDKADTQAGNYEYFGVCKYMPKFNTSDEGLQHYLIDIATHWINEYDIDGWRLDVSDEVSHDFWRKFRKAVKAAKSDAVMVGENWHDAYPYLRGDEYDSVMNYALTKAMMDYFVDGSLNSQGLAERLSALYVRNSSTVNKMMLNLLDSHDTHRFYTLVNGDADKLLAAFAIIFCHTGSACVYYGDETPLFGGHDPDSRRTMDWSRGRELSDVGQKITKLAQIKRLPVLEHGEIYFSSCDGKFILERVWENTRLKLTVSNGLKTCVEAGKILLSHNYTNGVISGTGFVIEIN